MPPENFFPPIGLNESVFTRDDAERLLKYRAFQQQAVTYVAASDTPEGLRYMAEYKCDGNADEVEIQEAIDNLPVGGGEILLLVGTYLLDLKITLPDNIVIRGQGPATVVRLVTDAGASTNDGVFENDDTVSGNSNITIRDMSIQAGSGVDTSALFIDNLTVGLFSGLTIDAANGVQVREAIRIQNCDRILIENSELVGFGDSVRVGGFGAGNPTIDCEVRNCLIYGAGSDGVDIESDSTRIRVIGNRFDTSGSHGIDVNGNENVIASNVIVDPGINGIDVDGNHNTVVGNFIYGISFGTDAIEVAGTHNTIADNTVKGNNVISYGVNVAGTHNTVTSNTIDNVDTEGIRCLGDHITIAANTIDGQGNTLSGIGLSSAASACTVIGNNIFDIQYVSFTGRGISDEGGTGHRIDGNVIHGNSVTDIGIDITGTDISVSNNTIIGVLGHGIEVTGSYNQITGNTIQGAGQRGIVCDGGDYCMISNNHVTDCDEEGIYLGDGACDSVTVNGNYVGFNSKATSNTDDGIFIANTSGMNHNSIINNVVKGSTDHRYGIRLDGANVNNTLVSNNELVTSGSTGAYSDAGTGTDTLGGNRT